MIRTGLRTRLLGLVFIALLPVLGLIVFLNIQDRRDRTAKAYEDAARLIRLAGSEQERRVDAARHLLTDTTTMTDVLIRDPARCAEALGAVFATLQGYANIGVASLDGRLFCSAVPPKTIANFADREWFQRIIATRQTVVRAVARGRLNGGWPLVVVATPLADAQGMQAIAWAGLELTWFAAFARDARLPTGSAITLVDARGTVLAREPDAARWVGREEFSPAQITAIVSAGHGTIEERGFDGIPRLYAFAPLLGSEGDAGMYLAIGVPSAQAFAAADRAFAANVALFAVALALTSAAAWLGGTALVMNPVRSLAAAAQRIGMGDFTVRVHLGARYGELSGLAATFDEMVDGLQRRDAALAAAAAARRASEVRLQWATIAESSRDGIIGFQRDGTVFSWNVGAQTLFGYAAGEAIGRVVTMLIPPERAAEAEAAFARAAAGEHVNDIEILERGKAGRRVESSCTVSPIHDPGGIVIGLSIIARDIAERRRANARLRVQSAALEAAANGIVITDPDGRIEWVNAAFTAMTGYRFDEAVERTPRILKSGRHDDAFYRELWATLRDGRVWRGTIVNRRKDGTLYDEQQVITPVVDAQGAIAHFVAVKQDVTAQRRSEEALRRSEEHFRSLIEHALDMIFVLDAAGVIRYASPSVERVLGFRPEDLVGQSGLAMLHPDDVAVRRLFEDGMRAPGFIASVEYRVMHRDGGWRTLEAAGQNHLHDPAIEGIVVNARDVTDRKHAEAQQRRLEEQLAQAEKLAAMGNLLAGVAHELNNPLAVVIGHTALMEATAGDSAEAARAVKIGDAAHRCARIVKNFLALARQHAPERTRVDLGQLVRETLEMLAYPLRVDEVVVTLDLSPDVPLVALDRHQIQQVVVNLVTNAHHALRQLAAGPRALSVKVAVDTAGQHAVLTVSDNGPGMPVEMQSRVFEPFFTTKPVGQGTGLGLSICRGIVEAHGGTITLATAVGGGVTFTIELPIEAEIEPPAVAGPVAPAAPCHVLVVDDEPAVVSVIAEMLRGDGHTVDGVDNGLDAVANIEARRYDVIVSDVKMPGLDGPALFRAVTDRRPELASRFVFVTGDTLSPATAQFLATTDVPSFQKPFSLETIRAALAKVTASAAV